MKTFRTHAILKSVIPHIACATSYVPIHKSVKCKRFNNVTKHNFNFYIINHFNGCVLDVSYQTYEEFELKKKMYVISQTYVTRNTSCQ